MTNIDKIDRKIIDLLLDDGTLTNTDIASRLGVSEATIRRRRARLQDEGVIRVVAVADPLKLGFHTITFIGIKAQNSYVTRIEQALIAMPEVRMVSITLGPYDFIVEAWFRSTSELFEFLTEKLGNVEGIQQTETFSVVRPAKYTWGKLTNSDQAWLTNEVQSGKQPS